MHPRGLSFLHLIHNYGGFDVQRGGSVSKADPVLDPTEVTV